MVIDFRYFLRYVQYLKWALKKKKKKGMSCSDELHIDSCLAHLFFLAYDIQQTTLKST